MDQGRGVLPLRNKVVATRWFLLLLPLPPLLLLAVAAASHLMQSTLTILPRFCRYDPNGFGKPCQCGTLCSLLPHNQGSQSLVFYCQLLQQQWRRQQPQCLLLKAGI